MGSDAADRRGSRGRSPRLAEHPAPSAPAEFDPWEALAEWCALHPKERRVGCNRYPSGLWKVWVEWNDDAVDVGTDVTPFLAAYALCDRLATRHPSSALPRKLGLTESPKGKEE